MSYTRSNVVMSSHNSLTSVILKKGLNPVFFFKHVTTLYYLYYTCCEKPLMIIACQMISNMLLKKCFVVKSVFSPPLASECIPSVGAAVHHPPPVPGGFAHSDRQHWSSLPGQGAQQHHSTGAVRRTAGRRRRVNQKWNRHYNWYTHTCTHHTVTSWRFHCQNLKHKSALTVLGLPLFAFF